MKKTLITLAALAMASVASADANGIADVNLSGTSMVSSNFGTDTHTDFTMTLVLDWNKIAAGQIGAWGDRAQVSLGTHDASNWWTTGFNMFAGGGNYTGQVAVTTLLDNAGASLTSVEATTVDGVKINSGSIGEGYFMVDNSHNMNGKLVLTMTYAVDIDKATDGNQSQAIIYALKNDGSLTAVSATQNNEWDLTGNPFDNIYVADKGAFERITMYDGVLTGSSLKYAMQTSIPEPTTATLSLLALAGLAARRRRK